MSVALADTSEQLSTAPSTTISADAASAYLKTYGVRAGSAGPDYLGITNTNYDFTKGGASLTTQYTPTYDYARSRVGMLVWATAANETPNPYYWNYYYNLGKNADAATASPAATTWMKNGKDSSWGDTIGEYNEDFGVANGLEYRPEIIYGANKYTNWGQDFTYKTEFPTYIGYINSGKYGYDSDTKEYKVDSEATAKFAKTGDATYNPTFANNDSTNIWGQVYSLGQLAAKADEVKGTKSLRYGEKAATEAVAYEKAIRGNLLYCASKLTSSNRKTVAYLYGIDGTNGTAYFFTPQASGLLEGNDTGLGYSNEEENIEAANTKATASENYAANNGTIDLGYMATLPFITDTYTSGTSEFIAMQVEDIWKANPACTLSANTSGALADVDVIIYNSTNGALTGWVDKKNGYTTALANTGDFANGLPAAEANGNKLSAWLANCGFKGTLIAGDDFGTSVNQDRNNIATAHTYTYRSGRNTYAITHVAGQAPLLYCQRNYTCDKNTRAAWAFSQVYPEFYGNNADASLCYWVENVYHVKSGSLASVVSVMTGRSNASYTESTLEGYFQTGYNWWKNTGKGSTAWGAYDYYSGSSRASYYSNYDNEAKVSRGVVGIFQPSSLWTY